MDVADRDSTEQLLRLIEAARPQCLWFLSEDYIPSGPEETRRVLTYLERYGDRETFLAARRLSRWLSRDSSGSSAVS